MHHRAHLAMSANSHRALLVNRSSNTTIHTSLDGIGLSFLQRHVATLADGPHAAGSHTARWDADQLASGVYFYRLEGAGRVYDARKAVFLK